MDTIAGTSHDNSKKRKLTVVKDSPEEIVNSLSTTATKLLYLNGELADIYFAFKSGDRPVPAHKIILAVLSPIFKTEFFGSMPEGNVVKIEDDDMTAGAFKEFLQFFYLKKMKLSMEHIQNVMYLCHKYGIDNRLKICSTFLKKNLSFDEMCLGYQLAIRFEQNDLREFCQRKINMNAEQVLKSEGFLKDCDWTILNEIVEVGKFDCREIVVLEASINWAKKSCEHKKIDTDDKENIRDQLKDVIYNIRFTEITLAEFSKYFISSLNPYNDAELKDIFQIMGGKNVTSTKFNCSPRLVANNLISWNQSEKREYYRWIDGTFNIAIPNIISTVFSSNKPLIFGEFFVYMRPFNRIICCNVSVERLDTGTKVIEPFSKQVRLILKVADNIVLPTPILIKENIKYKIKLDLSSNSNMEFKGGRMKRELKPKDGATIKFYPDDSSEFDIVKKNVIGCLCFNNV